MIQSIEVERLRGIRHGKLQDLRPLTVLVGPNGCGKSTILDALLIGAHPVPQDAVGRSVRRRRGVRFGAPWLFWRQMRDGPAVVRVTTPAHEPTETQIAEESGAEAEESECYRVAVSRAQESTTVAFEDNNSYKWDRDMRGEVPGIAEVRLVDVVNEFGQPPLYSLYTQAVTAGRRKQVKDLLREVIKDLDDFEILTEGDSPIVHFVFKDDEGSVPVTLAGDGFRCLTRVALELATRESGVVLLEEPEVHQHPATLRLTASAVAAAVQRRIQVVISTHSLELMDDLLYASEGTLDQVSVYSLGLHDGELVAIHRTGEEALFARAEIERDLR